MPEKHSEWSVLFERECFEEARAIIHYPIIGRRSIVGVAEVDGIPVDTSHPDAEDREEIPLVRSGDDSERLRNVVLIVSAPNMLNAIRAAVQRLREITDDETAMEESLACSTGHREEIRKQLMSDECWELWRYIVQITDDLDRAADEATDIELV